MAITDLLPSAVRLDSSAPVETTGAPPNGSSGLQSRALALRSAAAVMDPILATSYRRRASELELELWIQTLRSGGSTDDSPMAE